MTAERINRGVWMIEKMNGRVDDFAQVVRRNVGRQYLKLKLSDLENYRGERGRRGNRLPKGFQKVSGLTIADG